VLLLSVSHFISKAKSHWCVYLKRHSSACVYLKVKKACVCIFINTKIVRVHILKDKSVEIAQNLIFQCIFLTKLEV
jgi:hypothetical protein